MEENIVPQQNKSSRSFEDWKIALIKIIASKHGKETKDIKVDDDRIKSYYDRALMPSVCYNELFNS
jgi:rRNA pseudouridine-1189 N-methylase Emg1 (Nep1/Mra1 family)